jgi:hypothetical protein
MAGTADRINNKRLYGYSLTPTLQVCTWGLEGKIRDPQLKKVDNLFHSRLPKE